MAVVIVADYTPVHFRADYNGRPELAEAAGFASLNGSS